MPRAHMATILSSNPVTSFTLGNQQRFEAAVTIARHLDTYRAALDQNSLGTGAIALVGHGVRLGGVRG